MFANEVLKNKFEILNILFRYNLSGFTLRKQNHGCSKQARQINFFDDGKYISFVSKYIDGYYND